MLANPLAADAEEFKAELGPSKYLDFVAPLDLDCVGTTLGKPLTQTPDILCVLVELILEGFEVLPDEHHVYYQLIHRQIVCVGGEVAGEHLRQLVIPPGRFTVLISLLLSFWAHP